MSWNPKIGWPLVVLALGGVLGLGLVSIEPSVTTSRRSARTPVLRVAALDTSRVRVTVEAHGTVIPRTETDLVAEVAGRVTSISPGLAGGGFFELGDVLLEIDPTDYTLAVERSEASLEQARSELDLARSSRNRSQLLAERGVASSASLENAINSERVASAAVRGAQAALAQARRDLERTLVVAPFSGRVREKSVDVGQYVTRGSRIARVYAVDYAEVRLPIRDEDAAFVDLPIGYRERDDAKSNGGGAADAAGPKVTLRARFAGREHSWQGHIVRTEGELDSRTRMIHAVARVENPYGRDAEPGRPPLAVGLFVKAEIEGKILDDVYEVPRSAVRGRDQLVVVDAEGRMRLRRVEVVRRQHDLLLLRGGLLPGDRVPVTRVDIVVEGMSVRTASASSAPTR